MVSVLGRVRAPGVNLQVILGQMVLDPRNLPENLFAFLMRICGNSCWDIDLSVNLDWL